MASTSALQEISRAARAPHANLQVLVRPVDTEAGDIQRVDHFDREFLGLHPGRIGEVLA